MTSPGALETNVSGTNVTLGVQGRRCNQPRNGAAMSFFVVSPSGGGQSEPAFSQAPLLLPQRTRHNATGPYPTLAYITHDTRKKLGCFPCRAFRGLGGRKKPSATTTKALA
ncbi:hypothetical protein MRX96_056983 [Rhipicephalus microplus]